MKVAQLAQGVRGYEGGAVKPAGGVSPERAGRCQDVLSNAAGGGRDAKKPECRDNRCEQ